MQHFLYSRYYRHKLGCQYYILGHISPGLASLPPSSQLNLLAKWCWQLFCITRQKKPTPKPSNSLALYIQVVLKYKDTADISWHVQNLGMAQLPSKFIWFHVFRLGTGTLQTVQQCLLPVGWSLPGTYMYIWGRRQVMVEMSHLNETVGARCLEVWDVAKSQDGRPLTHLNNHLASVFDLSHQQPSG